MGIEAGIAVVTEHQQVARRHGDRTKAVVHRFGQPGFEGRFPIAIQLAVLDFNDIAGLGNHPLDQGGLAVVARRQQGLGRMEDHDRAEGQGLAQFRPHFLNKNPVLELQGGQHRARGNPARFDHGPAQQQGQG